MGDETSKPKGWLEPLDNIGPGDVGRIVYFPPRLDDWTDSSDFDGELEDNESAGLIVRDLATGAYAFVPVYTRIRPPRNREGTGGGVRLEVEAMEVWKGHEFFATAEGALRRSIENEASGIQMRQNVLHKVRRWFYEG